VYLLANLPFPCHQKYIYPWVRKKSCQVSSKREWTCLPSVSQYFVRLLSIYKPRHTPTTPSFLDDSIWNRQIQTKSLLRPCLSSNAPTATSLPTQKRQLSIHPGAYIFFDFLTLRHTDSPTYHLHNFYASRASLLPSLVLESECENILNYYKSWYTTVCRYATQHQDSEARQLLENLRRYLLYSCAYLCTYDIYRMVYYVITIITSKCKCQLILWQTQIEQYTYLKPQSSILWQHSAWPCNPYLITHLSPTNQPSHKNNL